MECWYGIVEYGLLVASIFSFWTMGQCHITRACCLFACNDFGQHDPSLVAYATMAMTHAVHTRHVPRRLPRPCQYTRAQRHIFKHCTHAIKTHDTRHTQLEHKARTKALAVHARAQPTYSNIGTCCKLTTHNTYSSSTRHVPRRWPRPCPCTTNIFKHWHMLQTYDTRHT